MPVGDSAWHSERHTRQSSHTIFQLYMTLEIGDYARRVVLLLSLGLILILIFIFVFRLLSLGALAQALDFFSRIRFGKALVLDAEVAGQDYFLFERFVFGRNR